jgi:hypothetical protein
LGVDNQPQPDEIQTHCPECGGSKLYFNVRKCIGICHKASCGIRPSIYDLIEYVGFGPHQHGEWEREEEEKAPLDIELPGWPILTTQSNKLMTTNEVALEYLRGRGIEDLIILNWGLTCDGERIYVPITYDDVLVNFNSRVLPGVRGPKYLYYPGAKTSYYILGWRECRDWSSLTLVENTFVSLSYRNGMQCSTTFGSNISDVQADLIAESSIREVALLWDENAESAAERAIRKLHDRGVRAAYWSILNQPDDYSIGFVERGRERVFAAAREGEPYVDLKEECRNAVYRTAP